MIYKLFVCSKMYIIIILFTFHKIFQTYTYALKQKGLVEKKKYHEQKNYNES